MIQKTRKDLNENQLYTNLAIKGIAEIFQKKK